jgi:TldD protein
MMRPVYFVAAGFAFLAPSRLDPAVSRAVESPVMASMRRELTRSMESLKGQQTPPYFLSYRVTDTRAVSVEGAFGTITGSDDRRLRLLQVEVRVGDVRFDNTHAIRGDMPSFDHFDRFSMVQVPVEDNEQAIRRALWLETDRRYKRAVEQYARVRANAQLRVAPEDTSPDFSLEEPVRHVDSAVAVRIDRPAWERRIRTYTAPFARHADIYGGEAHLIVEQGTRWYVNSEGSELQTSSAYARLLLIAYTRADDGMILPRYQSFVASSPEGLPEDEVILSAVDQMILDLHALKQAPIIEAATAPAILSGRASGVFFHEVFGHPIEGHRQKDEEEAQTFKAQIGERVLPASFSVYFDPTQRRLGNTDLAGYYLYDDEGVRARRVDVVTNGIFKSFLMSRSPVAGFTRSNGHGRSQPGFAPVARQSNLVVTSRAAVPRAELKRMLLAEIKRQDRPFGLIFDDIEGGFTMTTRFMPSAFEVIPVMVYRVFPDGREQLVRGVDIIGTPLTVFSKVIAADDDVRVFNGICGAESGAVPVAAASPAILVSQIEVQRKYKDQDQPPILPPPGGTP